MDLEPIPDEPVLLADDALVAADLHIGLEEELDEKGVRLPSRAEAMGRRLTGIAERRGADRLVLLGDVKHLVPKMAGRERGDVYRFFTTILEMALWAYTMYGASITPALLAAFLWPRVTRAGGVASIAAGMITTLGWEIYARFAGGVPHEFDTVYPALALSLLALVGVSLATGPPTPEEKAAIA